MHLKGVIDKLMTRIELSVLLFSHGYIHISVADISTLFLHTYCIFLRNRTDIRRQIFEHVYPRDDNSWYPVEKNDIRLISLISDCCVWSKHSYFQRFFKFFTLWPLSTDIWLIFRWIQQIFLNILLKYVRYLIEIWSIFSWYPLHAVYRFPASC